MRPILSRGAILALLLLAAAAPARAADKITAGGVGAPSAATWPYFIAQSKGFLATQNIDLDMVYAPTAPGVLQELTGGSLDIVAITGLPEPIHAVDKGAAVVILRIIGQVGPYALLAKPAIASIKDLKGKTISLGGLEDITKIYFDRMIAANGLKDSDFDLVVAGSTGARFAALKSGAIDATMLSPPLNFHAEAADFRNLGLSMDYARDLPFTGLETSQKWATDHKALAQRLMAALDQSIAWFYQNANRDAAIDILQKATNTDREDDVATYDFFRKIEYFDPTDAVSTKQLQNLIDAQRATGDVSAALTVDRLVMPGLTKVTK